jgi:tetratricopeptide (TPR) repeat protein
VVQAWLAEAELDAKNHEAAIAAADRALAADPRSLKALLIRGKTMLEMAQCNREKADWGAIRQFLIRANKVDPEAAEPLLLFYDSYLEAGQQPSASAISGLLYAHQIVPQDSDLRGKVVRQLLRSGKVEEARKAYGPIAYSPHIRRKEEREQRQAIMAALIKGDGPTAAKLLDEAEAERRRKAERD